MPTRFIGMIKLIFLGKCLNTLYQNLKFNILRFKYKIDTIRYIRGHTETLDKRKEL